MKFISIALSLVLSVISPAHANDLPICWDRNSTIPMPRYGGCTRVTDGPRLQGGYLVDCKGRKLCKLPEDYNPESGFVGRTTKPSPKSSSPYELGRLCTQTKKDGQKTYMINKCEFDINVKWNDNYCKPTDEEKYPCSLSIDSMDRVHRKCVVHDTFNVWTEDEDGKRKITGTRTYTRDINCNFGTITAVACKSPQYPYEEIYWRVVCN